MNNLNLDYAGAHQAWQQIIIKEGKSNNQMDDDNMQQLMGRTQNTNSTDATQQTFAIPFSRTNQEQRKFNKQVGLMNNSTYLNASDPNSMTCQGQVRNAVYNIKYD